MVKTKNQVIKEITIPEIIFHLGDIHIPGNPEREEEYETVLNRTVEIIKKETRNKMVVICGDLFHDKTKPYQEANILARKFMKNLGDVCDTIIIQGNHDINIDNESRKDSIKATLCELETKNKIYYLTENEQYKINGINFILTKMTNEKVTPIKNKIENELYIGLYHGTLYKSKTDENYEFKGEEKIKASDFENYDIVMLGDIHKYQYMNKEKTIAYCGSLVQQNFGESIEHHGMILWNLKTKISEFIEVSNDYIFKTHKIESINDIIIPNIDNKKCRLKLVYKDIQRLDLLGYEKIIKSKYNLLSITKQEIIEEIKKEKEITEEEVFNKNIIDVYKDFLNFKNIDEDVKVTELFNSLIDEEQKNISKEKKELKLYELEFENLFTYGSNNKINFTKLNGVNIISGTNGLGKSSIIDIILFTIYNKFSRGDGREALNIRYKSGYSILKLELNSEKYTIKRKIIGKTTQVHLFKGYLSKEKINEIEALEAKEIKVNKSTKNNLVEKNNIIIQEDYKNISDDSKKSIDGQILKIFGTYDEMIMTSVILQVGTNFIDIKDSDKKDLLIKVLGLNIYDNISKICGSKRKYYDSIILKKLESEISNIDYLKIVEEDESELKEQEVILKKYNEEYMNILKEKHILEHNLTQNNVDIEQIIIEKNKIINEKNKLNNTIKELEKELEVKNIKNIEKNKNNFQKKIENNHNKIFDLSKELKNADNKNISILKEEILIIKDLLLNLNKEYLESKNIINNLNKENKEILKILSTNKNKIIDKEKELENNKKNILDKLNNKKILNNAISLCRETNKELLKHTFNIKCVCCKNNKLIHEQIGYLEKLNKLELEYGSIKVDESELNNFERELDLVKKYYKNDKDIEVQNLIKDKKDNKIIIEKEKIKQLEEIIKNIVHNEIINEKIKEIQELNNYYKKQIIFLDEYNKNVELIKILENKIYDLEQKESSYKDNKDNIEKIKKIIQLEKNICEEINKVSNKIKIILKNILNNKNELEKQKKLKDEYKKQYSIKVLYDKIYNLYQSDFLEYVMFKRLNILEKKMNNILSVLSNYEIKIRIERVNTLNIIKFYKIINKTENKVKKQLKNDDEDKELNVKNLCGYERIIFNLSIRLALNNMNIITRNNFIIIDEGFSAADSVNIHKFSTILETIKKEYDICLLVSHIDEIKNQNGNVIKINYNKNTYDSSILIV